MGIFVKMIAVDNVERNSPWMSHEDNCNDNDLVYRFYGEDWKNHTLTANIKKMQDKLEET